MLLALKLFSQLWFNLIFSGLYCKTVCILCMLRLVFPLLKGPLQFLYSQAYLNIL